MGKPVPEVVEAVRQSDGGGGTCTSFKVSMEYMKLYEEIDSLWMNVAAEINTSRSPKFLDSWLARIGEDVLIGNEHF